MKDKIRTGNLMITRVDPNIEKILKKIQELEELKTENLNPIFTGDSLIVGAEQ